MKTHGPVISQPIHHPERCSFQFKAIGESTRSGRSYVDHTDTIEQQKKYFWDFGSLVKNSELLGYRFKAFPSLAPKLFA